MKLNRIVMQLVYLLLGSVMALSVDVTHADDILDVEIGMEDAFQDSEAAQLEARAAAEREKKKQQELEQAEQKAQESIEKAKLKEAQAKREIAKADQSIQKMNQQLTAAEEKRLKAEKRYQDSSDKIAKKTAEVEAFRTKLRAKEAQLKEQQEKARAAEERLAEKEKELQLLKGNFKEAHESYLKALRTPKSTSPQAARRPASTGRTLRLALKSDCGAFSQPNRNSSTVWSGKKGQMVRASNYDKAWALLNLEKGKAAYISKSCF